MKMLIGAIGIVILLSIIPAAQALKITQPFKELPATYGQRWALGYHSFPNGIYTKTTANDPAFTDGWKTAEIFANMKPKLKETPTSYAEGWLTGYHHKQVAGRIPMPPGHSPAWTHGFTAGYIAPKNTGFTDGWLAGRDAYLKNMNYITLIQGHTDVYRDGFNAGYHAYKDPYAGDIAYPVQGVPWTDPPGYD